jgi:hypothetical protein
MVVEMNIAFKKAAGWFLILLGVAAAIFSRPIVFPGLERIVGVETMVGKENVFSLPGGGYGFTNPGAMMRCVFLVAAAGIVICLVGIWLLIRASRERKNS